MFGSLGICVPCQVRGPACPASVCIMLHSCLIEQSVFGCSSSRHLRESTLLGLFAYTDFDLINLHLGRCGDCALSRQDQESSRQHVVDVCCG